MADFRTYIDRFLEPSARAALADTRVLGLVGARQVGKSTLARRLSDQKAFYTLDDFATLAAATADPSSFVRSLPHGAVIDEVQRLPLLMPAIKAAVDLDPTPGRLILTSSANLLSLPQISESLAGRVELLTLYPLSQAEIDKAPTNFVDAAFATTPRFQSSDETMPHIIERLVAGGYPEARARESDARRNAWFRSYVTTILERDIREISAISDILGMQRLFRLCAARSASILNETAIASEVGIPRKTVGRYLDLLEQLYLIWRLPAYARERGRRISKAHKIHLNDAGLAAYLYGADAALLATNRTMLGGLLETFVANELRALASWSKSQSSLFHYREYDGQEIDVVLENRDGSRVAIEIKATSSPARGDFQALQRFVQSESAPLTRGILLYGGSAAFAFGEQLFAVPLSSLWARP